MSGPEHLLTTKLFAPPPRPDLVERARLTAHLDEGLRRDHRLYLVSAPAGYGKTTLIASWLQRAPHRATWLSLDRRDDDLRSFLRYLVAALHRLDRAIGRATADLLASPALPPPATIAAVLLNDLATGDAPFALVLDDYQEITAPQIHAVIADLLAHPSPRLRLVLGTRVDPPLPLARLRARDLLTEVRADALRFTSDEAHRFFRQTMGVPLSPADVRALDGRIEGWGVGLQLAALSLRGQDAAQIAAFVAAFSGSNHYIIDYLAEEVLRLQDGDVREFLRQTAILDRLCAPLCDAVTGREDSQALLARLERANLFLIPLDNARTWYRYHHLFADVLRAELGGNAPAPAPARRGRAERARLHLRAATWFADHHFAHDAIDHALAGEAWEVAGRLIRQIADEMLFSFDYSRMNGWLDALPAERAHHDPELLMLRALFAYLSRPPAIGSAVLAELDGIARAQLSPRSWGRLAHIRATGAMLREEPGAAALLQGALDLIGADDPFFRQRTVVALGRARWFVGDTTAAGDAFDEAVRLGRHLPGPANTLHAAHLLALVRIEQGRRRDALALCDRGRADDTTARGQPPPTGDLLFAALAACAYEADELAPARELARSGREEYRRYGLQHRGLIAADQVLILAAAGLGAWEEAWHHLEELRRLNPESRRVAPLLALLAAELHLRRGDLAAAGRALDGAIGDFPPEIVEQHTLASARLLLARGQAADEALHRLASLEARVRAGGRLARLVSVHIVQALAHDALARPREARRYLAAALRIAAPEGYRRRFLDAGPAVAPLLPAVRAVAPDFVAALGCAFRADQPGGDAEAADRPPARPPLIEPLTQQERSILDLLAAGHPYREIAGRLFISAGTVRWHVHNIYGKLGVANRTRALSRARDLGLLRDG